MNEEGTPVGTLDLTDRNQDDSLLVIAPPGVRRVVTSKLADGSITTTERDRPEPDWSSSDPFRVRALLRDEPGVDGALLVASGDASPGEVLPGPVIAGTPVGVVTTGSPVGIADWLEVARPPYRHARSWAVMAMGKDEYLAPAAELHGQLQGAAVTNNAEIVVEDWRASRCSRTGVCARLADGPALGIYLGHGRSRGWAGYQAVRWDHVDGVPRRRPVGALFSLACDTLTTPETGGQSFGERFLHSGRAVSVLGAVGDVESDEVVALAGTIGSVASEEDPRTIGELLRSVHQRPGREGRLDRLNDYRLLGLPTYPIC